MGEVATLKLVILNQKEVVRRIADVANSTKSLPMLVVGAGGAHKPTRPIGGRKKNEKRGSGLWQEAKGFRLYLVGDKGRTVQIALWHQFQDAKTFRKDLALVAGRIPQDQVRVALLADVTKWLWPSMTACFPTGRPILDFFHCVEHIQDVAKAQFGKGELKAKQWAKVILSMLSYSEMDEVLAILREMEPRQGEAGEKIRKADML